MNDNSTRSSRVPPRWFVRSAWAIHRALYAVSSARLGLRRPREGHDGMLRLTTTGRRSGKPRSVIVSYMENGPDLILVAMNGWAAPDPAWWLNLQAEPEATVILPDGPRDIKARLATDDERASLAEQVAPWRIDQFAARRPHGTSIIILEPRA